MFSKFNKENGRNVMRDFWKRMLTGAGGSILFHVILVIVFVKMAVDTKMDQRSNFEVKMTKQEPVETTEEVKPPEPDVEVPPETQTETPPDEADVTMIGDPELGDPNSQGSGGAEGNDAGLGTGGTEVGFEVSVVKNPFVMKGFYAARTAGGKKGALNEFGGGANTEAAVMRALRWLKANQEADGSWKTSSGGGTEIKDGDVSYEPAMTGLALLAFLGHGETPASAEFGETVRKAIQWLMSHQDQKGEYTSSKGHGSDEKHYGLPIAAYAMCEAYGLTQIPNVKRSAEKAISYLLKKQHPNGGWYYRKKAGKDDKGNDKWVPDEFGEPTEDDSSLGGWSLQALKAAKMAGVHVDGLSEGIEKGISSMKRLSTPAGSFRYRSSSGHEPFGTGGGLTGVGTLCLQLLGQSKAPEVQKGLKWLNDKANLDWSKPWMAQPIYYWYYITQAKFHSGGETWKSWNKQLSSQLPSNQKIQKASEPGAFDQGYWPSLDGYCKSRVYSTSLCTLMLEVYYRYLPTFKTPKEEAATPPPSDDSISIQIK
jgi:hypothetical protein